MSKPFTNHPLLSWVMIAVSLWGGLLALGALLFGIHPETGEVTLAVNPLRGLIVLACVVAFVGSWWLLLWQRNRRS